MVALVEALEGFEDWNLSLKIEDKRFNSLGNGAKKLLTNADLESSHQKNSDRQHENIPPKPARKIQKRKRPGARSANENTP